MSENKPGFLTGTRNHVLDLDDFSLEELDLLFTTTDEMHTVLNQDKKKLAVLQGKIIVTLFCEPSTRTRLSFEEAGKILGADVINISSQGSSVEKGESLLNTMLTIQATGADIIIIRHPHSGAPHFIARHLNSSKVINAGDGLHAHPTQALSDLYTMKSHLGHLANRKVVIVGDILHSRVARSNLWGLLLIGARVVLCGPPTLLPKEFLRGDHRKNGHHLAKIEVEMNLDKAIEGAAAIMALRLQTERQDDGFLPSLREYSKMYAITPERLKTAQTRAILMHPGPMNEGVEISPDVAHGPQSVIEEQVNNSVAIRMSLLKLLLNPTGKIQ
jgi:aspartate carbamoyltransferase catalytic subunit